jgi:tyrosyl-tRNA synthetase
LPPIWLYLAPTDGDDISSVEYSFAKLFAKTSFLHYITQNFTIGFMDKIEEVLERWTEKIYPSKKEFLKILKSGKKLSFYIGIDPTGPDMHLGHSTNYLLMRELQKAGHKIILLVGDFTARIGDPSERDQARKPLTEVQIKKNMEDYQEQAGKILDFHDPKNPVELKFNSLWLSKLTLTDVIRLMAHVTFQQLIKRQMFQKRLKEGRELHMHEVIYPLLQGYDSVAMKIDAEIGGTDQTFNMLIGRDLVKAYLKKEKFVLTTPLLENPSTGKKLMSKSEGTYIGLNDLPNDMYGKTMALPDEAILQVFELCTEVPLQLIKQRKKALQLGKVNPMNLKKQLAFEIVKMYYSEKLAKNAEKEFEKVFQKRKVPNTHISIYEYPKRERNIIDIIDILVGSKLASSKSEAKRLIKQGAVDIDNQTITNPQFNQIKNNSIIKVGKRKFVKIYLV